MTRLLIVDDDPVQLRLLARIFSVRRRELSIATASNGHEAIEQLQSAPVDLVLTDLQMPEMNGFQLVAWLKAHQPHTPVFTMTAYPDAQSVDRLRDLGSIECFTKPLDIPSVLERLSTAITEGVRGHVRNISLTSFLQLVQMDRKTCTLAVESQGRTGYLYMDRGSLVGARTDDAQGDAAAIAITSWPSPAITIMGNSGTQQQNVTSPLTFILMEAMRLEDEAQRAVEQATPDPEPTPDPPEQPATKFSVRMPIDADALAVVETATGRVRSSSGRCEGLSELAQLAASVLRSEQAAISGLDLHDEVAELVLTTPHCWIVIRPVRADTFAMLVFDPHRATLVMERREMDGLIDDLAAWNDDVIPDPGGSA